MGSTTHDAASPAVLETRAAYAEQQAAVTERRGRWKERRLHLEVAGLARRLAEVLGRAEPGSGGTT